MIEAFGTTLEARLHLLPPYRRRLVEVPLGLDRPYWVDDPSFDLDYYPVSAVAEGQGLSITVQSYRDHLDFGLIACRELVPDLWHVAELFPEALEELEKRSC